MVLEFRKKRGIWQLNQPNGLWQVLGDLWYKITHPGGFKWLARPF